MEQTLQSGDELSHYRIVSPLGAGGMGEVYLAQDLTLERAVALKVLPGRLVKNEERLRRFVLEAKAASALNHPNIVTIHEIGSGEIVREGETPGSIHFIAMERIDGHTLHELIRRSVTPETGVVYISPRMNELKRITQRIQVIRDGQYIDTLDTATTTMDQVIARMVGRAINTEAAPENVRSDREVLLSVSNLSTKSLLKNVSFDLYAGEILGFAGLMGAGRTEVARAIVGADPSVTGTVTLRGKPLTIHNPADAAARGICYLSEDRKRYGLMLAHSVASNTAISSLSDRFSTAGFVNDAKVRAATEAQRVALRIKTPSIGQLTKNLSGGNQQKVIIGRWLVKDCDVLIFDEPTRGIDVGAKEEIYQLLNALAAQGKSIIMISSELPEVLRLSHRVLVMSEGRVTGVLPAEAATQESIMALATTRHADDVPPPAPTATAG